MQIDPAFLVAWVRAELGEPLFDSLCARAEEDGLERDEAELDVAEQLAARRGLYDSLEKAVGDLPLAEVREARGAAETLERSGRSCVAALRATSGAAWRLSLLAHALSLEPGKKVAELSTLGGSPGCSTR